MDSALRLYGLTLLLGLACLPLTRRVLDRCGGWAFFLSKPLALLAVTWIIWAARAFTGLDIPWACAWLAVAALAGAGLACARSGPGGLSGFLRDVRVRKWSWLAAEAAFAGLYALGLTLRACDPATAHTERPMDMALLTTALVHGTVPPPDPWLAGSGVSYYYLGHYLVATASALAQVTPALAYNCGLALILALTGSAAAGCGGLLTQAADGSGPDRTGSGQNAGWGVIPGAALALALVLIAAPPAALLAMLRHDPAQVWWWWESGRIIRDVGPGGTIIQAITEFPAFSLIVGDLHAHLMSLPFLALAVALGLNLFLTRAAGARWRTSWPALAALVPLLGFFPAADAWTLPAGLALLGAGLLPAGTGTTRDLGRAVLLTLTAAAAGMLLFLPFFRSFHSQFAGFILNTEHPTSPGELLAYQGPFLAMLLALGAQYSGLVRRSGPGALAAWGCLTLPVLAVIASRLLRDHAPQLLSSHGLLAQPSLTGSAPPLAAALLGALLALALIPACLDQDLAPGRAFVWRVACLGLLLLLVPEIIYVRDNFGTRMNTIFKFHYQAWFLLSLACAALLAASPPRRPASRLALAACVLLCSGALFTVNGLTAKSAEGLRTPGAPSLDGTAWLSPDLRSCLRWINANTTPNAVFAAAPGISYNPDTALTATLTGRPVVLGWADHELQWRGLTFQPEAARRAALLAEVYKTPDRASFDTACRTLGLDHIFIGDQEMRRYALTPADLARLASWAAPVHITPSAVILKVRPQ